MRYISQYARLGGQLGGIEGWGGEVLDSRTGATAFREGDECLFYPSGFFGVEPARGVEGAGVGEVGFVSVHHPGGHGCD